MSQPIFLNSAGPEADHAAQQLTIDRLQRISDYEAAYRKDYLPGAIRLQAEIIKRTPPTHFPDFPPNALTFGNPTGGFGISGTLEIGSRPILLGLHPLGDVADYLDNLAKRLP